MKGVNVLLGMNSLWTRVEVHSWINHQHAVNYLNRILSEIFVKVKKYFNFLYFALRYRTDHTKNCSLKSNWNHKLLIIESCMKSVQWFSSYNQRNKQTNLVTIFSKIYCFCCYVISQTDRQESIVISHLKSTAYRCKSLSN